MAGKTLKAHSQPESRLAKYPASFGAFLASASGLILAYSTDILSLYFFGGTRFALWISALVVLLGASAYLSIRAARLKTKSLSYIAGASILVTILVIAKVTILTVQLVNVRTADQQPIPSSLGNSGLSWKTDVVGKDYGKSNLNRIHAPGITLVEVNFSGSSLHEADFRETVFIDVSFQGADLCGADLRGADLSRSPSLQDASSLRFAIYDGHTNFPAFDVPIYQTSDDPIHLGDLIYLEDPIGLPEYTGQMIFDSGSGGMIYECGDGQLMQLTQRGRIALGR